MATEVRCLQVQTIAVGASRTLAIDLTDYLRPNETASGVSSVTEQTTSDMTLSGEAISSSAETVLGRDVAANKTLTFRCSGGLAANGSYDVLAIMTTSGGDTLPLTIEMVWE